MVRTEAGMVFNQNNHHHIDHHQGYSLQHPQFIEFFYEEELRLPTINTMMIMKMERCSMIVKGGS